MPPQLFISAAEQVFWDRLDAAIPVVLLTKKGSKYLIFETLAERTLALAQKQNSKIQPRLSPFLGSYLAHT